MFSTYHHTGNFTVTVVLTAWHLMAQGQCETFLPIYILKKMEIWSGATYPSQTDRLTDNRI